LPPGARVVGDVKIPDFQQGAHRKRCGQAFPCPLSMFLQWIGTDKADLRDGARKVMMIGQ
jgi:hypothetical protein